MSTIVKDYLDKNVDFKTVKLELQKKIALYVKNNIDILIGDGFTKRIVFGNELRMDFINTFNVNTKEFSLEIKKSKDIYGENGNNLLNIFLLYTAHKLKDKERQSILEFMALIMYSSTYVKYFKYGVSNEAVMSYTIENAPMSMDIKKFGTLTGVLENTVKTYTLRFTSELNTLNDRNVNDMISSLRTRINDKIKNVCSLYNENLNKEVGGSFTDSESLDKEALQLTQSENLKFQQLIDRVTHSETENGVDLKLLKYANAIKYREVIESLTFNEVENTIKWIVEEYYLNIINPSFIRMQKEFILYSFTNRKRNRELIALIKDIGDRNGVTNKRDFETAYRKYFILKINSILIRQN